MKMCARLSLWLLGLAALGGCSGMLTSDQPAEQVYWLESVALRLGDRPAGALPELVVQVRTLPGLDTDRILVRGPGARLNYYAGARWPDHLPEVITSVVRLSFESSNRFGRVSSGSLAGRRDWSLDLELREFFAVVSSGDEPPQVNVTLAGYINCGLGNTPVSAAITAAAGANKLSGIVAAFQTATNNTLSRLGEQVADHCFGPQPEPRDQPRER